MGNLCCSDRPLAPARTVEELPQNIDLKSLKKVQEELTYHTRDISRCKETLLFISDEIASIELKLSSVSMHSSELLASITPLHERAQAMITAKQLQNTICDNLDQPEFSELTRKLGKERVVRRLTTMGSNDLASYERVVGPMGEFGNVLEQKKEEKLEDTRMGDAAASAKGYALRLNELFLELFATECKAMGILEKVNGPLLASIFKRNKALQELKKIHQHNLLLCVVHETMIADTQKTLRPSQTLDQLHYSERLSLENQKDCEHKQHQLEFLLIQIRLKLRELTVVKTRTEEIVIKEVAPRAMNTMSTEETCGGISLLDMSDRTYSRFDLESQNSFIEKILDLRKILAEENKKLRRSQVSLQIMEDRVSESKEKLKDQRLKGMYFVLVQYFTFAKIRGLSTWKLRTTEARKREESLRVYQLRLESLCTVIGSHTRTKLRCVWERMSGEDSISEDHS